MTDQPEVMPLSDEEIEDRRSRIDIYPCRVGMAADGAPDVWTRERRWLATIDQLRTKIADLVAQNDRALAEYGAQDVLNDCREMLHAVGFGEIGSTNTLWGMVKQACAKVAERETETLDDDAICTMANRIASIFPLPNNYRAALDDEMARRVDQILRVIREEIGAEVRT